MAMPRTCGMGVGHAPNPKDRTRKPDTSSARRSLTSHDFWFGLSAHLLLPSAPLRSAPPTAVTTVLANNVATVVHGGPALRKARSSHRHRLAGLPLKLPPRLRAGCFHLSHLSCLELGLDAGAVQAKDKRFVSICHEPAKESRRVDRPLHEHPQGFAGRRTTKASSSDHLMESASFQTRARRREGSPVLWRLGAKDGDFKGGGCVRPNPHDQLEATVEKVDACWRDVHAAWHRDFASHPRGWRWR